MYSRYSISFPVAIDLDTHTNSNWCKHALLQKHRSSEKVLLLTALTLTIHAEHTQCPRALQDLFGDRLIILNAHLPSLPTNVQFTLFILNLKKDTHTHILQGEKIQGSPSAFFSSSVSMTKWSVTLVMPSVTVTMWSVADRKSISNHNDHSVCKGTISQGRTSK